MNHIVFSPSSVDGYLGCSHLLASVNSFMSSFHVPLPKIELGLVTCDRKQPQGYKSLASKLLPIQRESR